MNTIKDLIGIDPTTAFNPFAHAGAAGGEPEPRAIGNLTIELDPRRTPMTAIISDEDGQTIAQPQRLTALLAYLGRWNPGTRLLDLTRADGTIAAHKELFDTYHDLCRSRHKSLNNDLYRSYEAAGVQDKVKELDEAFLKQHIERETAYKETAVTLDRLIFAGHLLPIVDEYLEWLSPDLWDEERWPPRFRGGKLQPCKEKFDRFISKGWLKVKGNRYSVAVDKHIIGFLIGVVFCGDKYRSGSVIEGSDSLPLNNVKQLLGDEAWSDIRRRARGSKFDYSIYYEAAKTL